MGNQTRDLPAYSALPQPTASPPATAALAFFLIQWSHNEQPRFVSQPSGDRSLLVADT